MTHDKWDELLDYVGAAYAWLGIPIVIYFACWLLFVRLKGKLVVQWAFGPFILFSGIAVAPFLVVFPYFFICYLGFR